jgi:serine/threonine-protein kinase
MTDGVDRVLAGRYRLLRQLGQGGMGSVWEAEHLSLRSSVAVKIIDRALATSEDMRARFMREARAAASLRSPHVVQILDHGVDGDTPFIAMELLEGESLADKLDRLGSLPPAKAAHVLTHVARAVARAHEAGVVHRDLKPDNIFLVQNDDEELAKVLDFGIAKAPTIGTLAVATTNTGAMLGTPFYMSPEQAVGSKLIDHRTDIWAFGVIAFECLLGTRPFQGENIGELVLSICSRPMPIPSRVGPVPPGFDAWFARTCERNLGLRYGSIKECVTAFRKVCGVAEGSVEDPHPSAPPRVQVRGGGGDLLATTGQVSAATRPAEEGPRRSAGLAVGVVLAVGAVFGGAAWFLFWQPVDPEPAGSASVEGAGSALVEQPQPPTSIAGPPNDPGTEVPAKPSAEVRHATEVAKPESSKAESVAVAPPPRTAKPVQPRKPRITPAPPPAEPRPEPPRSAAPAPAPAPPKVDLGI